MAPPDVAVHATRVPFGAMAAGGAMDPTIPLSPVRDFAQSPQLDAMAELLAAAPLDAIAFAFTSSAFVIGAEGEAAMIARLERHTRGIPVVAASAAMVAALRELGLARVALVTPPWFDAELTALGQRYFEDAGLTVVAAEAAGLDSDQSAITPDGLFEWICEHTPADAEAVVVAGNGMRAVGVIAAVEQKLGCAVVTANQALLWAALRAASADPATVTDYGRLFGAPT